MPGKALYQWVEWCGAVMAIAIVGCAGTPVTNAPHPEPDGCVIAHSTGERAETLTIALPGESLIAFHGGDDPITRLIDGLRYEPLIRVDCNGAMIPALAESWQVDASGVRWTFTIRDGARLADGTPVTVRDIVASWRVNAPSSDRELARVLADSARIIDPRTMVINLPDSAIGLLSDPRFALRMRAGEGTEPLGTGAYSLVNDSAGARLHPDAAYPHAPRIRLIRPAGGAGPRDMLDAGADLLFTEDPFVVRYASAHPGLEVVPLPLRRVYVLISAADSSGIDESTMPGAGFRAALARDVVPARARPAEGPYWWSDLPACTLSSSPRGQPPTSAARIVYDLADPVAGALAQRLVALASDSLASDAALLEAVAPALRFAPSPPISLGLPSGRFVESLRAGNELAFIVALPVRPPDPCRALNVAGVSPSAGGTPVLLSPLVEAGGWAVVRRGRITLEVDWDGSIHIVGGGATPDGGRK